MAKASEQFRQSDVMAWGLVALAAAGFAVMSANVSALVPAPLLAGLHQTRLDGASIDQLRADVGNLRREAQRLALANEQLAARFARAEQTGNDTTRRVGALEVVMPALAENRVTSQMVDHDAVTAAIGGETVSFAAEGGSVTIRQQPLAATSPGQPEPPVWSGEEAALKLPAAVGYGIVLGSALAKDQAPQAWRDLSMKLGPLLFGLSPYLVEAGADGGRRILVGPIPQLSEASAICARLERLEVSCRPMPFAGEPLAP